MSVSEIKYSLKTSMSLEIAPTEEARLGSLVIDLEIVIKYVCSLK